MKNILLICITLFMSVIVCAQAPHKMSYQAVIRNSSNVLVTNATVGMRMSVIQTSPFGTAVYVEIQRPATNANGLVSIELGGGTLVSGRFDSIDWANGPYFIKTEIDPSGGNNYSISGTSQLLSVPYAIYAEKCAKINSDNLWFLGGNSNTNDSIHFIGTLDSKPLNFRVNNQSAGRIDHLNNNAFFGKSAGVSIRNGRDNIAIGSDALASNKNGNGHIAIGTAAMLHMTPEDIVGNSMHGNIGIGSNAMRNGVKGYQNYGLGNSVLRSTLNGHQNIAIGEAVLRNTIHSFGNIGIGYRVLDNTDSILRNTLIIGNNAGRNIKLDGNLAIGHHALNIADFCTSNTAVGMTSMANNTTGSYNATLGANTLINNKGGNHNVAIGYDAGKTNLNGNYNMFIGNYADVSDTMLVRASAIGYNAKVSKSNSMVLGGTGADAINVGIGVTAPARTLHIKSVMRLEPLNSAPSSPSEGDIYMNGVTHKLMVYDGTSWRACW